MMAYFKYQKNKLLQSCFLLFIFYFLISCNPNTKSSKQIFRYNEQSGIATLDPAFAKNQSINWVVHQLYNTLIETDDSLRLVHSLAKRWDISEDKKTYIFHLRSNIYFQDNECFQGGKGRKLTAADVVYSFKRIVDPSTASSGAWIFNKRVDSIDAFKALDDSTFQLKLQRPFNPILGIISMQYCSIVPHEAVEKYGKDFRRHPCGTGPFTFVAWEEGQVLTMVKNRNYWEKDEAGKSLPYLDGIKTSFLDSKAAEFLNFRQGKLDFINDIDASFKDEILTKNGVLKKDWQGKLILQKNAYLNTEYLGILVDSTNPLVANSPLRIKKIRQAINYSIDKKKLMLYLRNSIGTAAVNGFSPMGLPSFDSTIKGFSYNPTLAKQLLAEAGFPNGKDFPIIRLLTVPTYSDLGSYVASQLSEAGIPVQVEVIQKSLLLEQTSKSQATFFRGSWMADYPDAENYFTVFYGGNPAPPNYTRYKNATFDEFYEKALTETNDSLRYILYHKMDEQIIADAPIVPLWYDMAIHLVQPYVKGFVPNGLNLLELRSAYFSNPK